MVLDVQRSAAEAVLKQVQEHHDAWMRVDAILEQSKNQQTKFFGLQASGCIVDPDSSFSVYRRIFVCFSIVGSRNKPLY